GGAWYAGNGRDSITHRIVFKRICSIGENAARDIAAPTCVDEAADGGGRYIAGRNRQNSALLHPDVGRGSKLPDLGGPVPSRDVESDQDIELVVEHREATRQSGSLGTRPGRRNSGNCVGNGVVTKDAISSRVRYAYCRAA